MFILANIVSYLYVYINFSEFGSASMDSIYTYPVEMRGIKYFTKNLGIYMAFCPPVVILTIVFLVKVRVKK